MSNVQLHTLPTYTPLSSPLTGYKHHAIECLACSNTVSCNHTDSVIHSMHQRQSGDIPNKLQVCRSIKCHHCAIDGDLEWHRCSKLTQNNSHNHASHKSFTKLTVYSSTGCPPVSLSVTVTCTSLSDNALVATVPMTGAVYRERECHEDCRE